MESPLANIEAYPDFYQLETAFRCYFVEFKATVRPWKFYWSKPGEVGRDGIFVTDQMKEDVANGSERYFNDAVGDNQSHYNSTFTLMEMAAFDYRQSFLYRQHFAQQPYAFLGGLTKMSLESIPAEWKEVFLS